MEELHEIMLGKCVIPLGGESLGTMVRWRALVAEAVRTVVDASGHPGAEAYGEFIRAATGALTLDAKLALVLAWNPMLENSKDSILEYGTDEELERAFAALLAHAYPLAPAARPGAPMIGAGRARVAQTNGSLG
jgi:hypothetical protein